MSLTQTYLRVSLAAKQTKLKILNAAYQSTTPMQITSVK